MEEDSGTSSSTSLFFSNRAKFVPTKSVEELKAASELLSKIQEEKAKTSKVPNVKASYVQNSNVKDIETDEIFPTRKLKSRNAKKVAPRITDIVEDIINDNDCELYLSPAAKKRLKKQQTERALELKRIEDENNRILSEVNASEFNEEIVEAPVYNFEKVHVLTISYLSEVSRLKCYENEKFSTLFPKVAELLKLKVTDFLLCLREKNIAMCDTPKSLNIGDTDVLECIPYMSDGKTEIEAEYDQDKFKIAFQSNDNDEKIDLLVHKVEKMQVIMERYAALRNLPLNCLEFEFDGEMLLGTETPEELDMESGNCIDVKVGRETSGVIDVESGSGVDDIVLDSDKESGISNNIIFLDSNSGSGNSSDVVAVNTINTAPARGRRNPAKRQSPAKKRGSSARGCGSPTRGARGRGSPARGRGSPARGRGSPARGRGTPARGRGTPNRRQGRSRGRRK